MGSAISSNSHKRVCPKNFDPEKFKMILQLYDKLDSDGDNVIDIKELRNIADLHIKNRIQINTTEAERILKETAGTLSMLDKQYNDKKQSLLDQLDAEFQKKKCDCNSTKTTRIMKLNEENNELRKLDSTSKSEAFMDVVSKDKLIDFWEFFNYMKLKTGDIKNIEFD